MLYSEKDRNWMSCPLVVRGDRVGSSAETGILEALITMRWRVTHGGPVCQQRAAQWLVLTLPMALPNPPLDKGQSAACSKAESG